MLILYESYDIRSNIVTISFGAADYLLLQMCLYKGIMVVGKNSYKEPCIYNLIGGRVNDLCQNTGPVHTVLRATYSCSSFSLIILDVVAELGIYNHLYDTPYSALLQELLLISSRRSFIRM